MDVAVVLGAKLKREENCERHHPPKVAFENGPNSVVIDYKWTADCYPHTALKDPTEIELDKTRTEIVFLRGTLGIEMSVRAYPENTIQEVRKGAAYVTVRIRDQKGVIQKVLDLIPGRGYDMWVEVQYLDRSLKFQGLKFADGTATQMEEEYQHLSTHRVLELLSDRVAPNTMFTGIVMLRFHGRD